MDDYLIEKIEDNLKEDLTFYGTGYAFDLLKHSFQLAFFNSSDCPTWVNFAENEDHNRVLDLMADSTKYTEIATIILENDDCEICDLLGCEEFEYETLDEFDFDDNVYYISYTENRTLLSEYSRHI